MADNLCLLGPLPYGMSPRKMISEALLGRQVEILADCCIAATRRVCLVRIVSFLGPGCRRRVCSREAVVCEAGKSAKEREVWWVIS